MASSRVAESCTTRTSDCAQPWAISTPKGTATAPSSASAETVRGTRCRGSSTAAEAASR
ncbi:hypothetical protein ACFQZC_16145 [Streptacidiphilus monticola]